MDDNDRVGVLYTSLKGIIKDQFIAEKVLAECSEAELRVLEDLCSRCATYQEQDFFVAPKVGREGMWKSLVGNFLGRSRK